MNFFRRFIDWVSAYNEWHYLGYSEFRYVDEKKNPVEKFVVHFYGKAENLNKREVRFIGGDKYDHERAKKHLWYQKNVVPWVYGGNLWAPILSPSSFLKEWTERKTGRQYIGGKWISGAKQIARNSSADIGNVISFPNSGDNNRRP